MSFGGKRLIIRKAASCDEAGVRACAEDAYARYVGAIGRKPAPMVADFASQISKGCVYVAERTDDAIDGFIVFFPRKDHMFLENVAVRTSAAGNGVGKALIQFCEAEAMNLGLATVQLYTNEKMTENLSIYPHLGYVETARRVEDGFHRVFFTKRLDKPTLGDQ